jgi:hypothetical protein
MPMGRKKACFGREDYVCLTKDCPYMNECIQAVWEKKVSGLMRAAREGEKSETAAKGKGRR